MSQVVFMDFMRTTTIPSANENFILMGQDGQTAVDISTGLLHHLFKDKIVDFSNLMKYWQQNPTYYYDDTGITLWGFGLSIPPTGNSAYTTILYSSSFGALNRNQTDFTIGGIFLGTGSGVIQSNNDFFIAQVGQELRLYSWVVYWSYRSQHRNLSTLAVDPNLIPYAILAIEAVPSSGFDYGFQFLSGVGLSRSAIGFGEFGPNGGGSYFLGYTLDLEKILTASGNLLAGGLGNGYLSDLFGNTTMEQTQSPYWYIGNDGFLTAINGGSKVPIWHYNGKGIPVFYMMFNDRTLWGFANSGFGPYTKIFPAFGSMYCLTSALHTATNMTMYQAAPFDFEWQISYTYEPLILKNFKMHANLIGATK